MHFIADSKISPDSTSNIQNVFIDFSSFPLWIIILLFILGGILIGLAGIRLSTLADQLADISGMGEAIMGGVFLGASTSLSGLFVSILAAINNFPQLSFSNAVGGIAAQLLMLVIADFTYRSINLEHAAASLENIMWGILQLIMLAMLLFAVKLGPVTVWGISPVTPFLFVVYWYGVVLINKAVKEPMWSPLITRFTRRDKPDGNMTTLPPARTLWTKFVFYAFVIMVAGWLLTRNAEQIVIRTGLSQGIVGAVFLAISTSMAELVTALSAVRRGALTLAVGDIMGGNAFDCLFAAVADIFYRKGSIYASASSVMETFLSLTLIMAGILLMGLIAREKTGIARIGFEGIAIIACYALGLFILVLG